MLLNAYSMPVPGGLSTGGDARGGEGMGRSAAGPRRAGSPGVLILRVFGGMTVLPSEITPFLLIFY